MIRPRRFALSFALLLLSGCQRKVETTPTVIAVPAKTPHDGPWFMNPAMADDDLLCVEMGVWEIADGTVMHCARAGEVRHFILTRLVAE